MSTPDPDAESTAEGLSDDDLHLALEAVRDPVRRSILRQLAAVPDWSLACGMFDVPVGKATMSHHFGVLRHAGLVDQREDGRRTLNRLPREDIDRRFPGLLALVLDAQPE